MKKKYPHLPSVPPSELIELKIPDDNTSLILLIVFALYPLIDTFIISFLKDYNYINGKNNGLTLDNYKVLFQIIPPPSHIPGLSAPISAFFTSALPNTLLITFVTVPISIILALISSASFI